MLVRGGVRGLIDALLDETLEALTADMFLPETSLLVCEEPG